MEDSTKEYAKRFNQGYIIAKHEPQLFEQITTGNKGSDYIKTMKEGAKEATREQVRERMDKSNNQQQSNDIDIS